MKQPELVDIPPQPDWIEDALRQLPKYLLDPYSRRRQSDKLARYNALHHKTGLPFAGILIDADSGERIAAAVEFVQQGESPRAHPAVVVVAIASAIYGRRLFTDERTGKGVPNLEYFATSDQCPRCLRELKTMRYLRKVTTGATQDDVRKILKINPGSPPPDWQRDLKSQGIKVVREVLRSEAQELFREYHAMSVKS